MYAAHSLGLDWARISPQAADSSVRACAFPSKVLNFAKTVSVRRGAQCAYLLKVPVLGLHGVEDTVGSERFDRHDESEAAMEAEPFSGVAMPLDG
jgi:hypothetical protein